MTCSLKISTTGLTEALRWEHVLSELWTSTSVRRSISVIQYGQSSPADPLSLPRLIFASPEPSRARIKGLGRTRVHISAYSAKLPDASHNDTIQTDSDCSTCTKRCSTISICTALMQPLGSISVVFVESLILPRNRLPRRLMLCRCPRLTSTGPARLCTERTFPDALQAKL